MRAFTVTAVAVTTFGAYAVATGPAQAAQTTQTAQTAQTAQTTRTARADEPVAGRAAPARARVRMSVHPRTVRAGRHIRVTIRCARTPRRGFIDGPTSFGQIYLHGRRTVRVRVPSATPSGRHRVYGYCRARSTPSGHAYFRVRRR
ncbi:hypothetical protein [Thermomonospora umbrina]|uniref:Ig-like domain-containing protein n=1 Tax=Thermomonospora umbrina TaxID=111806 RepID=A0A3D9SHP9_9ACTN|nr:hypothetical protein [Thermomonospora umbrina]REE95217.1 hypothetical protein DFJ69_0600 [Thermomonospora umbrina]